MGSGNDGVAVDAVAGNFANAAVVVGGNNSDVHAQRGHFNAAVVVGNDSTAFAGGEAGDEGNLDLAIVVANNAQARAFNGNNDLAIARADGASAIAGPGDNIVDIQPPLFALLLGALRGLFS